MKNKKSFFSGLLIGMTTIMTINILLFGFKVVMGMTGNVNIGVNQKVNKIISYLNKYYVDDFDTKELEEGMYKGIVDGIGDHILFI